MKRYPMIDILKGICICLVIITHCSWTDEDRLKYFFPLWIDMAIPMCMVITGFVYTKSFQKKITPYSEQAYLFALKDTFYKRIIRYTIPFAIALTLEIFLFIIAIKIKNAEFFTAYDIIRLFLTGGYGSGSYYYPVLIQLAFLFPIIHFCIMHFGKRGLAFCCICNVGYELIQWAYELNGAAYRLLVFRYILLISYGCYFGFDGKLSRKESFMLLVVGLVSAYLNSYKGITPFFITSWRTTSFLTSLYIIPIFYYLHDLNLNCKLLELFGKASYNIFLTQLVFYGTAAGVLIFSNIQSCLLQSVICLMICLTAGCCYYFFEQPITKFVVSKFEKRMNCNKTEEKIS